MADKEKKAVGSSRPKGLPLRPKPFLPEKIPEIPEMSDKEIKDGIMESLMKTKDLDALQSTALTILNFNRLPISEDVLKELLKKTTLETVLQNSKILAEYGIIPEVEIVDDEMEGGAGEKRGREEDEEKPEEPESLDNFLFKNNDVYSLLRSKGAIGLDKSIIKAITFTDDEDVKLGESIMDKLYGWGLGKFKRDDYHEKVNDEDNKFINTLTENTKKILEDLDILRKNQNGEYMKKIMFLPKLSKTYQNEIGNPILIELKRNIFIEETEQPILPPTPATSEPIQPTILPTLRKSERPPILSPKMKIKKEQEEEEKRSKEKPIVNVSNISIFNRFKGVTYETLDRIFKDVNMCESRIGSKLLPSLFPTKSVSVWKEILKKDCRDIYEPSGVQAQCNNTIGEVKNSIDKCYICGFGFNEKVEGLQATCEHILPIIQAIFFLDLYRGAEKGKHTTEQMEILKKEYSWAHRCCNSVKSDHSFLVTKINKETKYPTWDFAVSKTTSILTEIRTTPKYAGTQKIQSAIINKGRDIWLQERLTYIRTEKMVPILNHINSKGHGGTVIMIGFGNCVDPNKMDKLFLEIISAEERGEDLSRFSETKRRRFNSTGGKTFRRNKHNGKFSTGRKGRSKKRGGKTATRSHSRK